MIIQARRFETIGFLHVSESIFTEDGAILKSWIDLAHSQQLLLIIDLNSAEFNPTMAATLKTMFQDAKTAGVKFNLIIADPTWNAPKTIQEAFQLINTAEAKSIGNAMLLEEKARELRGQLDDWDSQLVTLLSKYGKDMTALETMKPDDFVKLNHKQVGSHERLLAMYTESIRVLRLLDAVVALKKLSAEKIKETAGVKAQILGFLQQKGLS